MLDQTLNIFSVPVSLSHSQVFIFLSLWYLHKMKMSPRIKSLWIHYLLFIVVHSILVPLLKSES